MQKIDLSILPQGGINPVVRCSQGDVGRQFQIELYNEDCTAKYVLDGTEELSFEGIKPDGNIFQYDITPQSGSTVTISTTEQMTAVYGDVICELRILEAGGGSILGTANITLCVEIGPSSHDIVSASAIMLVDEVRGYMEDAEFAAYNAEQSANDSKAWAVGPNGSGSGTDTNNSKYYSGQSANSATASANSADDSKNWAVGPNGSGTGTDTNNSKYYSGQSSNSATASANSATDAKNWAVGPSGTGSGTDSNNAKYYANQSATSASDASDYKDAAVGAASASASSATDSKNWAVGPSGSGSGTDTNNSKYYATQSANSATDADNAKTDAVTAKNAAESAQQKIENMTASASGLPAGSSPTVTKSEVGGVVNLAFGIPKGDTGNPGLDGSSFWTTNASPSTSGGGYTWNISDLSGDAGKSVAVGDIIFQSVYRYTVDSITSTTAHCTVRQSIKGNTGTAATIAVGTVTTGEPGTPATVTNTGTSGAAVFDFSIPKGEKGDTGNTGATGPQGPSGVNKVYTGTCSTGASQAEKAVVVPAGQSFTLDTGAMLAVKFTNSNTASSVQLNVNSTTAKSIYYANAVYTGSNETVCGKADTYVYYVYDGTYWVWIGCGEASSGGGGGANESLVDWSQTNACRWRVSRFWDDQYSLGVELELNSELGIYEGVTNVQFGSQLIQDPMHYGNTYQSAIIDIPLNNLVSVYNGQNVDVLVEGNTYTFELYNDFADYSYFPATFSFNPGNYEWFDPHEFPPQSVLTRDVVVAGCTISRDNGIVYVRIGLWVRTAQKITTFADLCTALGLSSWGGAFGHLAGVIVLSKSKS